MTANDNIKKEDECVYRFTCKECGREIIHLGSEPKVEKCVFCTWLDEFVDDPQERAILRDQYTKE